MSTRQLKSKDPDAASNVFKKEFNILEESKKILGERNIPRRDLLNEFLSLRNEYERLLRTVIKITGLSDRSQKKLLEDSEETEINMGKELKNTLKEIKKLLSSLKDEEINNPH